MPRRYQFAVVRYVPNIIRDEGVNVGVLVKSIEGEEFEFKFLPRSASVRKLWPGADEKLVTNFARELGRSRKKGGRVAGIGDPGEPDFFDKLASEFNGNLQLGPTRGIAAEEVGKAVEHAFGTYVEEPGSGARPINYQAIAPSRMRTRLWLAFERRSLIRPGGVKKKLIVQGKHAPWTFDLGFENGRLNLINTVALNAPTAETNLGRALVLKGMLDEVKTAARRVRATAVIEMPKAGQGSKLRAKEAAEIITDSGIEVFDIGQVGELVKAVEARLG